MDSKLKKLAISISASLTAASLVGVSIACITNQDDFQKSDESLKQQKSISSFDEYNGSAFDISSGENIDTSNSSDEEALLSSPLSAPSLLKQGPTSKTQMMNLIPKKIEFNHTEEAHQKVLETAVDHAKLILPTSDQSSINQKLHNAKIYLPIDLDFAKENNAPIATITDYKVTKDGQSSNVKLTTIIAWTKGDVVVAKVSGKTFNLSV